MSVSIAKGLNRDTHSFDFTSNDVGDAMSQPLLSQLIVTLRLKFLWSTFSAHEESRRVQEEISRCPSPLYFQTIELTEDQCRSLRENQGKEKK